MKKPGMAPPKSLDFLSQVRQPELQGSHISEPMLIFGDGAREVDPKSGLALHGPFDASEPGRRSVVRLGVVGESAMIDAALAWFERCRFAVPAVRLVREGGQVLPQPMDPTAYPPFPGLKRVFDCDFIVEGSMRPTLGNTLEEELKRIPLFEPRITHLIGRICDQLRVLAEQTPAPDVVVCALSTGVRKLCSVPSRQRRRGKRFLTIAEAIRKALAKDKAVGQVSLLDPSQFPTLQPTSQAGEELEEQSIFHHGLKARAMEFGLPTQLAWQTTLEGSVGVEDQATRAWNFWTAVYYKAGGVPWRVVGLDSRTCYAGISFYRDKRDQALHSCIAQAFSSQGEGLVLRSEPFRWEPSAGAKSPHLPKAIATDLMAKVVKAYRDHVGNNPGRIVVHKWQRFTDEEREGLSVGIEAAGAFSDLVALGDRGLRFFRTGAEPALRGTMIPLAQGNALVYTRGYVPFLGEYPGMRVPRPVEVVQHIGASTMTKVCEEILALTKLDWNTAAFASKDPITTAFAEDVGHILAELPKGASSRPQYRFYI